MQPLNTAGGPILATAGNWQTLLSQVGMLGLDVARHKLIDVERISDDNNIPDQAELRYGALSAPAFGGLTIGGALILVGVVLGVTFFLSRK